MKRDSLENVKIFGALGGGRIGGKEEVKKMGFEKKRLPNGRQSKKLRNIASRQRGTNGKVDVENKFSTNLPTPQMASRK